MNPIANLMVSSAGVGPDLVLLHAGIADRRMWASQIGDFSREFRVTSYDLRGFGESPMTPGPYAHFRDLRTILDHFGIERAALIGASMGGSVALDFALESPDRVSALLLVDPGLDGYRFQDPWLKGRWQESEAALERGDFEDAARIESETWLAGPERSLDQVDGSLRELVRTMLLGSYPAAAAGGIEEGPDTPSIERLEQIRVPVLVVVGEHDVPDMKRIAELLEQRIPEATRETIEGAAHLPSLERPAEFHRIARQFLTRARGPGPPR